MVKEKLINGILSAPRALKSDESVLLEVAKFDDTNNQVKYGFAGIYPDQGTEIKLVPELYIVKATLMKDSSVTIPEKTFEQCKCSRVLGICPCEVEEVTVPSTTLDSYALGGAEFDWTVHRTDLSSNHVVFYVISNGVPKTYEELNANFDFAALTLGNEQEVKPIFQ